MAWRPFLTSAIEGGEWPASPSGRLTLKKKTTMRIELEEEWAAEPNLKLG